MQFLFYLIAMIYNEITKNQFGLNKSFLLLSHSGNKKREKTQTKKLRHRFLTSELGFSSPKVFNNIKYLCIVLLSTLHKCCRLFKLQRLRQPTLFVSSIYIYIYIQIAMFFPIFPTMRNSQIPPLKNMMYVIILKENF